MRGAVFGRAVVLIISALLIGGLAVAAQDPCVPDLVVLPLADLPITVDSGQTLQLDVGVLCLEPECLVENPRLQVSLRRHDKPEACAVAVEILAKELLEDGNHVETVTLDMGGLSGGTYEIVVEIDFDRRILEQSEANNRNSSFVRIADPLIEIHPIGLSVEPASPIDWGESAVVRTSFENSGGLAAGALFVHFDLLPVFCSREREDGTVEQIAQLVVDTDGGCNGADWVVGAVADSVADLAQLEAEAVSRVTGQADTLCGELWTRISSVAIAGLARNAIDDASAILVAPTLAANLPTPGIRGSESFAFDECTVVCLLRVETRPDQPTGELDASNNTMLSALRFTPSGLDKPDFLPVAITFDEDLPLNWDDDMVVTATITNRGGAPAQNVEVFFDYRRQGDLDWQPLRARMVYSRSEEIPQSIDILGIEEGLNTDTVNTRDVHLTIDPRSEDTLLTPGTYELRIYVDKNGEIAERNERNNQLVTAFSVRGSELRPVSLEMAAGKVRQGDSITVSSLVENTGDRPVDFFTVSYYIDDVRFDTFYYASTAGQGLDEDEHARAQGVLNTEDLPAGEYLLRVVVDPDNDIPEFDESDNVMSAPLLIEPPIKRLAELHPIELRIHPTSPVPLGIPMTVSADISNAGSIQAGPFEIVYMLWRNDPLDTYPVAEQRISLDGLDRGASARLPEVSFDTFGIAEGDYCLEMTVDPAPRIDTSANGGVVEEFDETNNTIHVGLHVGPPAPGAPTTPVDPGINLSCSLGMTQFVVREAGIPLAIEGVVANTGANSAAAFQLAFVITDRTGRIVESAVSSVYGLGPGTTLPFSRTLSTANLAAGVYGLTVQVDPGDSIEETDEGDNLSGATVQIGDGPTPAGDVDLVPIAVRFDSPGAAMGEEHTVEPNQRLYAYVTIRNDGTVPSGSFVVAFETALGVETELWTSVGPLDQVEVSHPVPTGTPGRYDLTIRVDPDQLISELDDQNNAIPNAYVAELPAYVVLSPDVPSPDLVVSPSTGDGAVRWLQADSATGRIYVVSRHGTIRSIDSSAAGGTGAVEEVIALAANVTAVAWSFAGTPYAYVGISEGPTTGEVVCVDLKRGAIAARASVAAPTIALTRGGGTGQLFAAVDGGFHQLTLAGSEFVVSRMVAIPGDLLDVQYDEQRSTLYVLSTEAVTAYGETLQQLCTLDAANLVGTPSVLAVAGSGVYVATEAGTGSIVYAASHCTPVGADEGRMLVGWRYPRMGTLPGNVSSIVIDPRDIDPIYVATDVGVLYAMGFDGHPLWSYETSQPIRSALLADKRTGRIFFGDDGGVPHVLTLAGVPIFEIDTAGHGAGGIRSTLAIVETRERTDLGTRFVRNYYYGTETGAVYRIASQE